MATLCNEQLFEDGKAIAVCTQVRYTEHDHSSMTAREAIGAGVARPGSNGDRRG